MAVFSVYSGSVLMGYCTLEHQDPGMGVAFGRFEQAAGYPLIQAECRTNHQDQSSLNLRVQTHEGKAISCAGVSILDYSNDVPDCIEVTVFAIASAQFLELFAVEANQAP